MKNRHCAACLPTLPTARKHWLTPYLGGLLLASTASVPQASADEYVLEEVLVTATKRGEVVMQDMAVAIQAVTEDQMRNQVATEISDLAPQISSLVVQDLGPGDRKYIIRGVNSTATATVGVYYDEAVITARSKQDGGGRQADIELHDLARVEVLKGPQGTLYGASSMSGTVRYVPNKPNLSQVEGAIGGTASTTEDGGDNYQMNGMINIPLIKDKLAARALAWTTDEDGYIDNLILGNDDINDNEVTGYKLALEWAATDDLTLSFFGLTRIGTWAVLHVRCLSCRAFWPTIRSSTRQNWAPTALASPRPRIVPPRVTRSRPGRKHWTSTAARSNGAPITVACSLPPANSNAM